jgi:hypothetical protein
LYGTRICINHAFGEKDSRRLLVRLIKNIGIELKTYDEAFPVFAYYKAPEFDKDHFWFLTDALTASVWSKISTRQ